MKNLKSMTVTSTLAIVLALSPALSTAGNHERGYSKSKIAQKHLTRTHSKKFSRRHNNQGHYDQHHEERHNEHNHHNRHDHNDHHDYHHDNHHNDHYDRHHHGHRDHHDHWFYSMNHNIRHGFGFQFGIHK